MFSAATKTGSQPSAAANYIEDVFSTYLYTGTSAPQTITNNIDESGKGALTWIKSRSAAEYNLLFDTVRGATNFLRSSSTGGQVNNSETLTSFNNNGFSLGADNGGWGVNTSGNTYASWTFAEQAKFFDVVTFTATGSSQAISHSLASTPGMIFFKRTDGASNWLVWNRTYPAQYYQTLNTTAAAADLGAVWCTPTSTNVTISTVFGAGQTWVAYLFAHDAGGFGTSGTDNVISCGSFTTDGSGNATVNLGYEPQYLMFKSSSATGNWFVFDVMRGFSLTSNEYLRPNLSDAEGTANWGNPTATGFTFDEGNLAPSTTFIYMAIRRPMKVPTTGTSVFSPISTTGSGFRQTNFVVDMFMNAQTAGGGYNTCTFDRLRGNDAGYLITAGTGSENTLGTTPFGTSSNTIQTGMQPGMFGDNNVTWAFSRRPKFFDEVCYTGTGSATTQAHNLGVAPELMIVKCRNNAEGWNVYSSAIGNTKYLVLYSTDGALTSSTKWNNTTPTSSVFTVGTNVNTNYSGYTYVAYLFATCAGVSKVGSYTGTGATQTINCGFTGGARFVLIKRTDSTGDWYVWDTSRGMVAGTDPSLSLNTTTAESNANSVYTATTGFQLLASPSADVNTSGGTYIYLAIA